ncbi:MAG: phage terminase small subunit-related protein [bacterium]
MTKKHLHYNEAERCFVYEQMTIEEIASRLKLGERTVRYWKDENGWDDKKKKYIQSKIAFHEELYEFAKKLMRSINQDLENGEKVDPGRMYAFTRMLPLITKIKEYEDVAVKKEKIQEPKGLTEDVIKLIEKEVLGMNSEE